MTPRFVPAEKQPLSDRTSPWGVVPKIAQPAWNGPRPAGICIVCASAVMLKNVKRTNTIALEMGKGRPALGIERLRQSIVLTEVFPDVRLDTSVAACVL